MDGRPLDREEFRLKLQASCASAADADAGWSPEPDIPAGVPAAVLIGLVAHPEGLGIILTERTADLVNHAAEISLPGGKVEPGDDGPAAAALREAFEEIGLTPDRVEVLGCLSPHRTISGFCVHPFVGWIEPPVDLTPDTREVADIFEVPLEFVLDPANHHRDSLFVGGVRREFYVLPYPGHRIWGATAGILVDLAEVLGP